MLKVCYETWNQSPDFLRELALNHEHPRTRERFLALYEIATGLKSLINQSLERAATPPQTQ